jgi:hypothetical protein
MIQMMVNVFQLIQAQLNVPKVLQTLLIMTSTGLYLEEKVQDLVQESKRTTRQL